jgi:hypothetical protein
MAVARDDGLCFFPRRQRKKNSNKRKQASKQAMSAHSPAVRPYQYANGNSINSFHQGGYFVHPQPMQPNLATVMVFAVPLPQPQPPLKPMPSLTLRPVYPIAGVSQLTTAAAVEKQQTAAQQQQQAQPATEGGYSRHRKRFQPVRSPAKSM